MTDRLADQTQVHLTFIKDKIEQWSPFGRPSQQIIHDDQHRTLLFAPGALFALARWTTTSFGGVVGRLHILRAVTSGRPYTTVALVWPGAEVLLALDSWARVEKTLQLIEHIRTLGIDPADAAPDYWLHVGNRLAADQPPRPYNRARHAVWTLRRRIAP